MPQIFQALRCFKCSVFQVHQTKKANKFVCKLCGEKQSIKRHYGIGTAKDCRLHVQKLNGIRKDIDELNNTISSEEEQEIIPTEISNEKPAKSKWSAYVEPTEMKEPVETVYLEEVVLEVPKKKRQKKSSVENSRDTASERFDRTLCVDQHSPNTIDDISKHIDFLSQSAYNNHVPDTKISVNYSNTKKTFSLLQKSPDIESSINIAVTKNVDDRKVAQQHFDSVITVSKISKWAQFIDNEPGEKDSDSTDDLQYLTGEEKNVSRDWRF